MTTSLIARSLVAVLAVALLAPGAGARDESIRRHPGYVDPTGLVELANESGHLVEVTLSGKLLKLFSSRAGKRDEASIAGILSGLRAINAVICDVSDDPQRAKSETERIRREVEKADWERFVRVRDDGQDIVAYIHTDDEDEVNGLLVLGFGDNREFIFVNLVGRIDMERIALLGEQMGMPGLDDLPPRSEVERRRRESRDV